MLADVKVGERLFLSDAIIEVTEISVGFITVKSDRDFTFQENEKIKMNRNGTSYWQRNDVNNAFVFLSKCGIDVIDYVAVPVERASDVVKPKNMFALPDEDTQLRNAGLRLRNYEGIIAKVGSYNGLFCFEEILSKLDSGKDAIMIDRTSLALDLKYEQISDTATSIFVKKSAFESVTSIVSGNYP